MTFNKALIALALTAMLTTQYAEAKGGRSGGFSSSRSSSSRSYSRPSTPASRPAARPTYTQPNGRRTAQPTVHNRTYNRTTVVHKTVYKTVYRPTRVTSNYNSLPYYHQQPRPSHFQSNVGWYAFAALAAYMVLSDDEKAQQPGPDTAPLKEVGMKDISTQLWADGKFDETDLALYNEWKRVNGK